MVKRTSLASGENLLSTRHARNLLEVGIVDGTIHSLFHVSTGCRQGLFLAGITRVVGRYNRPAVYTTFTSTRPRAARALH